MKGSPPVDLDSIRNLINQALKGEPDVYGVSDIDDTDTTQRVIGIETENGAEFFVTIQPA